MMNTFSTEMYARLRVEELLEEARRERLARGVAASRPGLRLSLARALRGLAMRLDDCSPAAPDSCLATAP